MCAFYFFWLFASHDLHLGISLYSVTTGSRDRAYAFCREVVCRQKSVRKRNFFENAGHVSFSFCQAGSAETHTKPCKTSPQGTSIKRPAIYWDHAVSWGGGGWVSVSDIELRLQVVKNG